MSGFIPDQPEPTHIQVGTALRDLMGGTYRVDAVTEDYFDVRSLSPAFPIPDWLRTPGVHRYRWDETCPLRPIAEYGTPQ